MILKISDEGNGDFKFDMTTDKGYTDLLNQYNGKGMIIEMICWTKPQQSNIDKHEDYCKNVESRSHFHL